MKIFLMYVPHACLVYFFMPRCCIFRLNLTTCSTPIVLRTSIAIHLYIHRLLPFCIFCYKTSHDENLLDVRVAMIDQSMFSYRYAAYAAFFVKFEHIWKSISPSYVNCHFPFARIVIILRFALEDSS